MARIDRRTVIKGLGTAIALPTLEAMLPLNALAQSVKRTPNRVAFLFVPNGMHMDSWRPGPVGTLELSTTLQPLDKVKHLCTVVSGLEQQNANALGDGPGDHARSTAAWLTGVHPKKTAGSDIRNGISIDQVAAQRLAGQTRFASLELGCERSAQAGDCDSGYSCAYSSNIAWRSESTPVAKETNPRLIFERLFGGDPNESLESRAKRAQTRKSVLDFVLEDADSLRKQLGKRDLQKLDEYLSSVREIEQRLVRFEQENPLLFIQGIKRPEGTPNQYGEHIRLVGDMMILAFQANLTRVCTFMFANEGSNRSYRMIGISDGHHDISHHGKEPGKMEKKRQIDLFHVQQLAYILEKMQSIEEPGGTLLENSMIVYGGGISDGDRHNHDDLPILIAGGGTGKLNTGKHVRLAQKTPMNNLFLSLMDQMGIPIEQLGDSTGKFKTLF